MAVVPELLRPPAAVPPFAAAEEWARVRASTVATTGHWVFVGAIGRDGYPQVWAPPAPGETATSVRVSRCGRPTTVRSPTGRCASTGAT
jgi:hypothetical protein